MIKKNGQSEPDIIRECSNSVLSKIEEQGIHYCWQDGE